MTTPRPRAIGAAMIVAAAAIPHHAHAQSLYLRPPALAGSAPVVNQNLRGYSLMLVEPPPPREFKIHDLVTIVINEVSSSESSESLETEKEYDIEAAAVKFPSLRHLLEAQLVPGDSSPLAELEVGYNTEFEGEGEYARDDRFTARITATIIDVKPNGVLVIEARKTIQQGEEIQTIVLSGLCRQDDITDANTVQSSQIADLTVRQETEGQVQKSAKKGLIPRVLETLFAF